jgi:dTDP-4-amino-4,6-dideoxygalactose transaminase
MRNDFISYSKQKIFKKDVIEVCKSLKKKIITQGFYFNKLKQGLIKKFGFRYCLPVANASNALLIALRALDVKPKDIIWTSNITFCSNVNAGLHLNSKVRLIDVDLNYPNISLNSLERNLIKLKKKDHPKVLIVTHMGGVSTNMKKIYSLSKKYKFKILEDASHCIGAKYQDEYIGSCKYSDITVFSMHAIKIITSGEGGFLTFKKKNLYEKSVKLISHYIYRSKSSVKNYKSYDVKGLGYNFRMTEMQSALAFSQLSSLGLFKRKRLSIAEYYLKNLNQHFYILPEKKLLKESSLHLFIINLKKNYSNRRDELMDFLRRKRIETNINYIPNHLHSFYKKNKNIFYDRNGFKNSIKYYKTCLSIPIHYSINKKNLKYISSNLNNFFND